MSQSEISELTRALLTASKTNATNKNRKHTSGFATKKIDEEISHEGRIIQNISLKRVI